MLIGLYCLVSVFALCSLCRLGSYHLVPSLLVAYDVKPAVVVLGPLVCRTISVSRLTLCRVVLVSSFSTSTDNQLAPLEL